MADPTVTPNYTGEDAEFMRLVTQYHSRSRALEDCAFHNADWKEGEHSQLWNEFDRLSGDVYETFLEVLKHRSQQADTIATKIEVCMAEYPGSNIPMEHLLSIAADARQLSGRV